MGMAVVENVADNLKQLQDEIAALAQAAGRDPAEITLVAVSKTHPATAIQEALATGHTHFGENRVQELQDKQPALPESIQWHLIGHLQTNKVKYLAPYVHLIHSVDSEKLLKEIDKRAAQNERTLGVLIQVNISEEDQKSGAEMSDVPALLVAAGQYPNVAVKGLMGMAQFTEDEAVIRRQFRSLRTLRDELLGQSLPANVSLKELSMGMSGDYAIAIEEGATILRIGSAIFGARGKH